MIYTINYDATIEVEIEAENDGEAVKKAARMLDNEYRHLKIEYATPFIINSIDGEDGDVDLDDYDF